ncbi:hypothetical protein GCM10023193_47590 [Planotetraspora kaengkrachanensis]|uniref:Uncharacterized protein n=1 Tax=Planotetraspora kaengkrachanensis TaxID=575193 RepID=A0A8J3PSS9_9ACTN|nr:hypothetical protein Pka01_38290 [Planotetraspora kaengkrachanensis]
MPYGLRVEHERAAPVADDDVGVGQRVDHGFPVAAGGDDESHLVAEASEQVAEGLLRQWGERKDLPRHGRSLACSRNMFYWAQQM